MVGGSALGVLERAYGLDRPYRPHIRRVGAIPVLQRRKKWELVRLRIPARCRLSTPGYFGREGPKKPMTRVPGKIDPLLLVATTAAIKSRYYEASRARESRVGDN